MRILSVVALCALTACHEPPAAVAGNVAASDEVASGTPPGNFAAPAAEDGMVHPDFSHAGEAPPAAGFLDPAGKPVTLAAFAGKPLLVNLWATWCAPCVAELPTLEALAAREGNALQVVAVDQDLADAPAKVAAFFTERRLVALKPYRDPQLALSVAYQANLPTTILYGADGKERWRVTGGMDWTSADAGGLLAKGR